MFINKQPISDERGFSLIECTVAMVVTLVGVLAVSLLIINGIRLQVFARDATMANALARAKVEELRVIPKTDPRRQIGGDLQNNVANYFDTPNVSFTRRWSIVAGPVDGTEELNVVVISNQPGVLLPTVSIRTVTK